MTFICAYFYLFILVFNTVSLHFYVDFDLVLCNQSVSLYIILYILYTVLAKTKYFPRLFENVNISYASKDVSYVFN